MPRGPVTTRKFEVTALAPNSSHAGTAAYGPGRRLGAVIAISRRLPDRACGKIVAAGETTRLTCPPSAAVIASYPPLNVTTFHFLTSPPAARVTSASPIEVLVPI